jgi:DUF1680 family protein
VKVMRQTNWPDGGEIEMRVTTPHSVEFALHLCIPKWLDSPARIAVNGRAFSTAAESSR